MNGASVLDAAHEGDVALPGRATSPSSNGPPPPNSGRYDSTHPAGHSARASRGANHAPDPHSALPARVVPDGERSPVSPGGGVSVIRSSDTCVTSGTSPAAVACS